jgi:hypothetical protein
MVVELPEELTLGGLAALVVRQEIVETMVLLLEVEEEEQVTMPVLPM